MLFSFKNKMENIVILLNIKYNIREKCFCVDSNLLDMYIIRKTDVIDKKQK